MMLRRKNAASPARCPNPPSRKNRTGPCPLRRSSLPQCNRAPKPPNRAHRRRGTLAKSQCKPNFRRLVPTMMASIAGGTRVGRVCSVAFGLIARRVGRVTRIAMVGCASGRTRTIERDTKGAKTRFIAPAYRKFESSSVQQRVNKLSVPEEGYRSGRSTTLRVGIRDNDPAGYDLLVNATAADGAIPFVLRALGLGAAVIDVLDGKSAMNEVSGLCLLQDRRQLRGLEASMWPVCQ